jgi:hypothetical protein
MEGTMKRGLAPAGVAFMGLAVALAILGVGYGLWSDTLRISGAVATGSVNAAFSLHEVDEGLARGAAGGPADNDVWEDKEAGGIDTAECYVRIYNAATPVDEAPVADTAEDLISARPSDFLFVYLKNAYPSFNCYVDFDVHNVGSIPIKVNQPVIGPQPGANILTVETLYCYENGVQVEPGKEALCTLHVHVERGAAPNSIYRFGATICAYQWNVNGPIRCAVPVDIEPIPADLADEQPLPLPATRP